MKIEWTPKKKDLLAEAIENWMQEHHAYSGEMMHQNDDCNTDAIVLLADIVDDIIQPDTSDEDEQAAAEADAIAQAEAEANAEADREKDAAEALAESEAAAMEAQIQAERGE